MSEENTEEENAKRIKTTIFLHDITGKFNFNWQTDPRFKDKSSYARHLIRLGMKADKKERDKRISDLK